MRKLSVLAPGGTAPMCQINDRFFENLSVESLMALIDCIQKERPDLSLSSVNEKLGDGLGDIGFTQIK